MGGPAGGAGGVPLGTETPLRPAGWRAAGLTAEAAGRISRRLEQGLHLIHLWWWPQHWSCNLGITEKQLQISDFGKVEGKPQEAAYTALRELFCISRGIILMIFFCLSK